MSEQTKLDLVKALKKKGWTLARLHRELEAKGDKLTYRTLQNYIDKGSQKPPTSFTVLSHISELLEVPVDKLLK